MSGLVVRPARESDADTMAATEIAVLRPCRRLGQRSGMFPERWPTEIRIKASSENPGCDG